MRNQDWNAVAEHYIREAGGDPRFVLKSMDDELEKVAGLLDWGARVAGRAAIGAGERLGGYGLTRGVGEGMSRWGSGVFARQQASMGGRAAASAAHLGKIEAAQGVAGVSLPMRAQLEAARRVQLAANRTQTATANVWGTQAQRGAGNAERFAATRQADAQARAAIKGLPAPAAPVATTVPAATRRVRPARNAAGTANPAAQAAANPEAAAQPGWGQQFKGWWGNPNTTNTQRYGLVAGGAAVPALGLGLMAGGGSSGGGQTTIIQR